MYKNIWHVWTDQEQYIFAKNICKKIVKRLNCIPINFNEFIKKNKVYKVYYSNNNKRSHVNIVTNRTDWKKAMLKCI